MFDRLIDVIKTLRRRCPWDRKQTLISTRPLLLNEVYELDEALGEDNCEAISEELGDYLFMGLFLAHILEEKKGVKLRRVLEGVIKKLKLRHPHVYDDAKIKDTDGVLKNWERIKKKKGRLLLDGIPIALPALQQAQLIQERCRRVGFDWGKPEEVLDKVKEEIEELELASRKRKGRRIKEELGDLLFAIVNLCRHLDVNAEAALRDANRKFRRRFGTVESEIRKTGRGLEEVSLEEMERLWQEIKKRKRKQLP